MKNSKLAKLKAEKAKQFRLINQQRHDDTVNGLQDVKEALQNLYDLINGKDVVEVHDRTREVEVRYDWDKFVQQIETITKTIDIKEQIEEIKKAIAQSKPEFKVEKVDLSELIKVIQSNKPEPVDFSSIEKAIIEVSQRIQESTVEESQAPEDYKPFRRVVKVGNRLLYDDQPTPANRASGGGSSSGGGEVTQGTDPWIVGATDFDIRNLAFATDKVDVSGSTLAANSGVDIGDVTINNSVTSPVNALDIPLATRIDEASGTVTYIGSAQPGSAASAASWQIKKIDSSSGTIITFADGDGLFNNVWNDRASLSYS